MPIQIAKCIRQSSSIHARRKMLIPPILKLARKKGEKIRHPQSAGNSQPRKKRKMREKERIYHLPGLGDVDHIDTIRASLPEVRLHVNLEVLGTDVSLSSEEHLNVLLGGLENIGQLRGSHFDDCDGDGPGDTRVKIVTATAQKKEGRSTAGGGEEEGKKFFSSSPLRLGVWHRELLGKVEGG